MYPMNYELTNSPILIPNRVHNRQQKCLQKFPWLTQDNHWLNVWFNTVHNLRIIGRVVVNSSRVIMVQIFSDCNTTGNWSSMVDFFHHIFNLVFGSAPFNVPKFVSVPIKRSNVITCKQNASSNQFFEYLHSVFMVFAWSSASIWTRITGFANFQFCTWQTVIMASCPKEENWVNWKTDLIMLKRYL